MFFKNKTEATSHGYRIIRSNRKSIAIEISRDLSVIVRAPNRMRLKDIELFVNSKSDWINKHIESTKLRLQANENRGEVTPLSDDEIKELTLKAKQILPQKAEYFAEKIGVKFNRITIKHQHTLWGSCSGKKNLNFNCVLMLCPDEVQNYVVVHELCHLLHMNHSPQFWSAVESFCPDYKKHRAWLKTYGKDIIRRLK